MRIGVGAAVGIAAAALRRIAVVLHIALADHVLRHGVAVLAHRLMQMRAAFAGKVAFHTAAGRFMVPVMELISIVKVFIRYTNQIILLFLYWMAYNKGITYSNTA